MVVPRRSPATRAPPQVRCHARFRPGPAATRGHRPSPPVGQAALRPAAPPPASSPQPRLPAAAPVTPAPAASWVPPAEARPHCLPPAPPPRFGPAARSSPEVLPRPGARPLQHRPRQVPALAASPARVCPPRARRLGPLRPASLERQVRTWSRRERRASRLACARYRGRGLLVWMAQGRPPRREDSALQRLPGCRTSSQGLPAARAVPACVPGCPAR